MSRPQYETESDRLAELAILKRSIAGIAKGAAKLPKWYQVDFALLNEASNVIGVAECKRRRGNYTSIIISLRKVMKMLEYHSYGYEAWFMVSLNTRVHRVRIHPGLLATCVTAMGGRWDRGDDQDIEPVVHIPLSAFEAMDQAA
jgi:hypothetical protein